MMRLVTGGVQITFSFGGTLIQGFVMRVVNPSEFMVEVWRVPSSDLTSVMSYSALELCAASCIHVLLVRALRTLSRSRHSHHCYLWWVLLGGELLRREHVVKTAGEPPSEHLQAQPESVLQLIRRLGQLVEALARTPRRGDNMVSAIILLTR